jgi:Transposase family tnp2
MHVDIGSTKDDDDDDDYDEDRPGTYFNLPSSLSEIRKELLQGYTTPAECPDTVSAPKELTPSEMASLKHYIAWKKSNGTVLAYKLHAQVLQCTAGLEILSLFAVKKLAATLTDLWPSKTDMCPRSCIAYTGEFEKMDSCPYVRSGKICGELRYQTKSPPNAQDKPRAQMMSLSFIPLVKAMFANAETAQLLRHRDKCLQKALHLLGTASQLMKYSDFGDSRVHIHHYQSMKLFQDPRDIAFAISTDGAQLTMKKQSNTWILILIFLNFPPEVRCQSNSVFYPFAIPGPNSPGHIESFLWGLFEQMMVASEGIWMWDAVDSSHFVNHACFCMALGDMLGSAKLNGMAGHSAIYGDRFSMVKGARASLEKGAKAQYYPISPPECSKYNPGRPEYDLCNLPLRQESVYWETIAKLEGAPSKASRANLTKDSGISRMPLCAASPAFLHPSFFPLDPFHLFYENCMAFLWDLWMTLSSPSEVIHIDTDKARQFGQLVSGAMSTLPASFCGLVRDPFLKRQSQYKIYEWMALLHWYIIPIGIEVGFSPMLLSNFSDFVEIVETAMTIAPRSTQELVSLHQLLQKFLKGFERIYVAGDPEKVSRCRLCIFQLIHVPQHIEWNGSIRAGSQATVERAIGEVGHKIRSKKAPFANLANIIYEKELIKTLLLLYPSLYSAPAHQPNTSGNVCIPHHQLKMSKMYKNSNQELHSHINAICLWLGIDFDSQLEIRRWGKIRLPGGSMLRSRLSETQGRVPSRSARYFEAQRSGDAKPVFGEALAFFEMLETKQLVVIYYPLNNCEQVLKKWRGVWSEKMEVLPASAILSIVGIWSNQSKVYILRKHPGLALLSEEERGTEPGEGEEKEE